MNHFNKDLVEILKFAKDLQSQKELYNYGNISPDMCKGCIYRNSSVC
jgi:hypothetical protein